METRDDEHAYVTFPVGKIDEAMEHNVISHEEICEPDECAQVVSELTVVQSDDEDDNDDDDDYDDDDEDDVEKSQVYPIDIKREEQHQYTSGDDESMAVEALRQLGGMYPSLEEKKMVCPNCGNIFMQSELTKHSRICASVKLSCPTCREKFERKQDLKNHTVCHQVDRPHACRTCGNLFRSKANLQTHMSQVHRTVKVHKCTICGADFQRPSSLSNHMKIHTYVAGRAIMQSRGNSDERFGKWPDSESQNSCIAASSSVQSLPNYDVSQVQWSVPSYNFGNDQTTGVACDQQKIDSLQEFAVMPNGELEYAQQSLMNNPINEQYGLSINSFGNTSDSMVKIESLSFASESRRNYVEIEIENDSRGKPHTCAHCGLSFSRGTALASHEKIHEAKNWRMPIECEFCDKQFQDGNHLATHQTTCGKKLMRNNIEQGVSNGKWGKHACTECGKKFTTKQKMFRHQWIHRKKTHSCEICGTQFEKQNQLDEHRLSVHPGDSPFTCSECGKSFVSRQGLWEHGRTHAGSPAHFHCDTCSKTFSSRQGYLIHHRTHTGERPYGCKFCWKAFRDGGTLRKHERIHTGERPHVCPLCSRAFNQKVVLREHVRWVHAAGKNDTELTAPPYPCSLCGALNQDRDELCAHIVKHSDQMIAEAKAKSNNNAPKPKPSKKKSKSVLRNEQNEALLSIAAKPVGKETLVLVPRDKDMGKEEDTVITKTRNSDNNLLHFIETSKRTETLNLIAAGKSNLITKQNESLPVLTIPNPESVDGNGSSDREESMMDEETANVDRVVQYFHQQNSDEDEEMVCGICGDDFHDKNVLMEHVKIHI